MGSDDTLKRLREIHEASTSGPWQWRGEDAYVDSEDGVVGDGIVSQDARAIAAYHNTYAALLDVADAERDYITAEERAQRAGMQAGYFRQLAESQLSAALVRLEASNEST